MSICLYSLFSVDLSFFVELLKDVTPRFFVDLRVLSIIVLYFAKVFSYDGHMVVNHNMNCCGFEELI
jgi:hypothetical protein